MDEIATAPQAKPLWRRIVDFPLVALLIALLLLGTAQFVFGQFVAPLFDPVAEPWRMALLAVTVIALVFALYKLVIRHLGEIRRDDLRLPGAGKELLLGFGGAGLLMSAIVGVAALLGVYRIAGWGGSTSWAMILFQGTLVAGFVEEVIFRGILFRWIEEFAGSWFALALTSILFGWAHLANDNATPFSSLAIAVEAGIMLGAAYMLTRSLWLPIGIHMGWNFVQGYVWDVPVSGHAVDGLVESRHPGPVLLSGGDFGLEASVIGLVMATGFGLYLLFLAIKRGNVMRWWWARRPAKRAVDPA